MKQFTDLLDEYLEAKDVLNEACKNGAVTMRFEGKKNAARDALNEAFEQMKGEKSE